MKKINPFRKQKSFATRVTGGPTAAVGLGVTGLILGAACEVGSVLVKAGAEVVTDAVNDFRQRRQVAREVAAEVKEQTEAA